MIEKWKTDLWDAINRYVTACGGTTNNFACTVARHEIGIDIERAIESNPALAKSKCYSDALFLYPLLLIHVRKCDRCRSGDCAEYRKMGDEIGAKLRGE